MRHINSKKGFTLVELLVAISIMGIIMVIALPQLSNIQQKNETTKYKKYAQSLLASAKLYTDSYSEDMFGNNQSGCVDIRYSDIKAKNLLKDFKIEGATCAFNETFIRVRKANGYYFYETSVMCQDKNGSVVYNDPITGDSCNEGPDEVGPEILLTKTPETDDWTKGTNHTVTIKIWDSYGMLENTKIRLDWTKDNVHYSSEEYDYKNKRHEGHSEATALNYTFTIPQSETGIFVLRVTPINVRDSLGNYTAQQADDLILTFKLDNTAPSIPTVEMYKWNSETAPTTTTGLTTYASGDWTNKNIYTRATGSSDARSSITYQYTTTGAIGDMNQQNGDNKNIDQEGQSKIKYRACDEAGNCSKYSSEKIIKIDKTSPTITSISNPSGGKLNLPNLEITCKGSDNQGGSGIAKWQYKTGNNWNDFANSNVSTYKVTYTEEIKTEISIRLCDNVGNCSDPSNTSINISKCAETTPTCGDWSACSATCGGGKQTRTCQNYSNYDNSKCGNKYTEERSCNEEACPAKTCKKSVSRTSSLNITCTSYNDCSNKCISNGRSFMDAVPCTTTYTVRRATCFFDESDRASGRHAYWWRSESGKTLYNQSTCRVEVTDGSRCTAAESVLSGSGIAKVYRCDPNTSCSTTCYNIKCSQGEKVGWYCYLYDQTSCPSGWEEVKD